MSNRMRLCLKCSLLFAILIGIVVFAPHPDDEVIGCAGIMMQRWHAEYE
jgi:hypothetical protein